MIVTWIGHATVLIQTNGLNILTDPIYSETAGPLGFGPKRVAMPGVKFEDLPKIDLVLVSHNHYDHMDLPTLKRLWERDHPTIVTSLGNDTLIKSTGAHVIALDWDQTIFRERSGRWTTRQLDCGSPSCWRLSVRVTRNHHWGSRWFTDRHRALWSSFKIDLAGGAVFFAGDTGFGDGEWPREAAIGIPIRLALIPIGAFRFQPGQMQAGSHIGPIQAVEVFRRLGARYAMPIHWGTFRLSWEAYDTPPKMLDRVMMCRGLTDFTAYPIGAPVDVPPIDAPRAKLPPVPRPASCDARPFAPDLR
jgi:L-ascorbate metabolism protein UlaG (beta-lactamase superfamily)